MTSLPAPALERVRGLAALWSLILFLVASGALSLVVAWQAVRISRMSKAFDDLTASTKALEAHAAAVNAERLDLYTKLQAALAAPPPAAPSDDAALQALQTRVDAVSASIVAPVATLAPPAPAAPPAPPEAPPTPAV